MVRPPRDGAYCVLTMTSGLQAPIGSTPSSQSKLARLKTDVWKRLWAIKCDNKVLITKITIFWQQNHLQFNTEWSTLNFFSLYNANKIILTKQSTSRTVNGTKSLVTFTNANDGIEISKFSSGSAHAHAQNRKTDARPLRWEYQNRLAVDGLDGLEVCSWCRSSLSQRPLRTRYCQLRLSASAICSDWYSTGPRARTATGQRSFAVNGTATWNRLPPALRTTSLCGQALWEVTRAVLAAQLLYARPAWSGFLKADEISQLQMVFIARCYA